jgi:hypothetical protein
MRADRSGVIAAVLGAAVFLVGLVLTERGPDRSLTQPS